MHRYRLEFAAESVDEARLRDVLEREFRISGIVIVRDEYERDVSKLSSLQSKSFLDTLILELLSDGKPWRRKSLIANLQPLAPAHSIDAALMRLERSHSIKTLSRGIIALAQAEPPIQADAQPLTTAEKQSPRERALPLLTEPKSAGELREALGVSRQRAYQILKNLTDNGTVRRLRGAGDRARHFYVSSEYVGGEHVSEEAVATHFHKLHESRGRLLSSLAPETLSRACDLASVAKVSTVKVATYLEQLSAGGLAIAFKLGKHRYAIISRRGLQHPQYDAVAPKAAAANFLKDIGEERARHIQFVQAFGRARAVDPTHAEPEMRLEKLARKSRRVFRELELAGIVERSEGKDSGGPFYRLTDKGSIIAGPLFPAQPTSTMKDDSKLFVAGDSDRSEIKRSSRLESGIGAEAVDSPTQAAIVRALQNHARLTANQIVDQVDAEFKDLRSIHLALRALSDRGVVLDAGIDDDKTHVWELQNPECESR